jgi:clan AA aspartic protease (TIGR02281 family)
MLVYIQNKLEEQEEYPIQIPLIRKGLHFLVKASANNIPMLLLVDTGASVTTVDNNLIANFTIIKENARFHTAGGEVYNTIFQADSFELGSVFFENFTLSGTDFSGRDNDGLLGMNFLGKFKFKIDQQEAILYLGEKSQF